MPVHVPSVTRTHKDSGCRLRPSFQFPLSEPFFVSDLLFSLTCFSLSLSLSLSLPSPSLFFSRWPCCCALSLSLPCPLLLSPSVSQCAPLWQLAEAAVYTHLCPNHRAQCFRLLLYVPFISTESSSILYTIENKSSGGIHVSETAWLPGFIMTDKQSL